MKAHFSVLRALCLALIAVVHARAVTSDFSDGWRFHLGDESGADAPEFADSAWETVTLPHPARLEARVTNKSDKQEWEGICWYRKSFSLPANAVGQVVLVRFEGAMNRASLFANGTKIAENTDGYLPLVGDLSRLAKTPGTITLAVRLDNASSPVTGPKPLEQLDFHRYHGLYRPGSLIIKPPLHITDEILENKPASGGVFVTYPKVSTDSATVSVQVHLRNSGIQPADCAVVARLTTPDGKEAARKDSAGLTLAPGEDRTVTVALEVRQPRLWSTRTPHLLPVLPISPPLQLVHKGHPAIDFSRRPSI